MVAEGLGTGLARGKDVRDCDGGWRGGVSDGRRARTGRAACGRWGVTEGRQAWRRRAATDSGGGVVAVG